MPFGSVNVAAWGAWMVRSGEYLRSLGEGEPAPAGAAAAARPRAAAGCAAAAPGDCVPPRPDPGMPPTCARAAAARRRMLTKIFIADLRSCAPAVGAEHRTGQAVREKP